VNKSDLILYSQLLADIKERVRHAQQRAILSANAEMILMYWDVGRMMASRQQREGWGAKVIPRLAVDLKNELPEKKGFSPANLKRMVPILERIPWVFRNWRTGRAPNRGRGGFARPFAERAGKISAPPVRQLQDRTVDPPDEVVFLQLSWSHNIVLMQQIKDLPTRLWYARQMLDQGWARDTLTAQIKSGAHQRQGTVINNFKDRLPSVHARLASGLLKDPYLFDFVTMEEQFHERELETGLLTHIEKFLLELGRGFAFVGRQYRLEVSVLWY